LTRRAFLLAYGRRTPTDLVLPAATADNEPSSIPVEPNLLEQIGPLEP
jgi:hypothetical protein